MTGMTGASDDRRGMDLARDYWCEVVGPLLPAALPHAAARVGTGSDVLGLDDAMSRDHDWRGSAASSSGATTSTS